MAVIKVTNSKGKVDNVINYVTKKEKTEEKLISGKDCNPATVKEEMKATKEQWSKTGGRQYIHYVQSFKPNEIKDLNKAHKIGKEWAENNFKGHEVLVATHKDKDHIHNHFVVNSVNYENGKKFQQSKKDLARLKEHSDRICERQGLSVIKGKSREITSFNQGKYQLFKRIERGENIKSYVLDTALTVEKGLEGATDKQSFIKNMESQGYKVNWKDTRKYITFTTPEGKKVRNKNLEKTFKDTKFSKEGLENEFTKFKERDRGKEPRAGDKESQRSFSNVDWSAVGNDVKDERNRVPEHSSHDVTREIQQKVRGVKERTKRAIGEDGQEDRGIEKNKRDSEPEHAKGSKEVQRSIREKTIEFER